jgi:hypothetical protein
MEQEQKDKFERWAKEWDDKLPNLAKALRSESLHNSLDEMDMLVKVTEITTKLKERALIIYVIESALADETFNSGYRRALKDEIENHKIAIQWYQTKKQKDNESGN